MSAYVDHGKGCPKCGNEDLMFLDSDQWGEVYWEKYRCRKCGYEFTDEFWYHHTYDNKEADDDAR